MNEPITKIVIHCSDSPHGRGDDARDIHLWHIRRNFSGCGYHWIILEDGAIQPGRPWYWSGAHVMGHNQGSLGICLIGKDEFTDEQMGALVDLYNELSKRWPDAEWFNHYDLDPRKTCPNFDAARMLTGCH